MSNENPVAVKAESPLIQVDITQHGVSDTVLKLNEEAFLTHINLRGDPSNKAFMKAVSGVLKLTLPTEANTFTIEDEVTVLWYGPDEWLILTSAGQEDVLVTTLKTALKDIVSAVTDVSGGNTIINISGLAASALLTKGTTLDLHATQFSTGQCAQTLLAKATIAIYQLDDSPHYRVVARRSFADYLGLWLLDAAQEFQHSTDFAV